MQEYCKALYDMRSGEVSLDRLREAEKQVWKIVEREGGLIFIGDLLTVVGIETAIESVKDSWTN